MSQRLTVSVALCTHNGAGYLREQLVSIVEQDYPVTQIVVGDDASSDATLAIVAEVAETLQRSLLPERLPELPGLALAARYVAGSADTIAHGIEAARAAIACGDARAKLEHFIATTRKLASA